MANTTHIEWTRSDDGTPGSTWNPITGCTLVSDGCANCYAAQLAATRLKHHPSRAGLARLNRDGVAKFTGEVRFNEQWLDQPLRWKKPRRIFVVAHGDLFHENVPDEWIDKIFAVMALAQQHEFQVLTKRPDRMAEYSKRFGRHRERCPISLASAEFDPNGLFHWDLGNGGWHLPNVWIGTSVENQATADERIQHLLNTPASVRFLSCEPLLGPVDLSEWLGCDDCRDTPYGLGAVEDQLSSANGGKPWTPCFRCWEREDKLSWVICGGESGKNARPMDPDWARSIRDQCQQAGVAYFHKQNGAWLDGEYVGKKAAGRLLDGRTWDEMPNSRKGEPI